MINIMQGMLMISLVILGAIDVKAVDPLLPLYPDLDPIEEIQRVDVPRGGIAAVHLVIDGVSIGESIKLDVEGGPRSPVWYRLIDVPVEENTGPESRTERWDQAENPHVIRDAPFQIYEVMEPITGKVDAENARVALRVEWEVPVEAKAGDHCFELQFKGDAWSINVPMQMRIHDAVVPPIGRDTMGYTNWFSPGNIAKHHHLELWSEPFWEMLQKYAELMARGRQNMFWVKWPDFFERINGTWVLKRDRLIRYVQIMTDAGLYWIEGAPCAGRPDGDWSSAVLELKLGGVLWSTEEGETLFANQADQMDDLIERQGWRDRWVQHIADEPTDVNAADYCRAASMMRRHLHGVPIFEATMSRELTDCVDMWCPQIQEWQANRAFFDEQKKGGDRIWVYTCLRPGGPWLNRLLDQERLRQVYFGWGAAKEGWDGYLHWGLNHWKADPFLQSVVDHPAMPKTDNRLPAGDTHVLYPGPSGPWSGLRFEAHRVGLEDHAMLVQLQEDQRAAMIDQVYTQADEWVKDVRAYRDARAQLLQALAGLRTVSSSP